MTAKKGWVTDEREDRQVTDDGDDDDSTDTNYSY